MNKLILFLLFALSSFFSFSQYPIQTIFKGDSVVILSLQQSNYINSLLEKQASAIDKNSKEYLTNKQRIDSLNMIVQSQYVLIDSLQAKAIESIKQKNSLVDSLWIWALGPSLLYTQYPDDSTLYIMDLSYYYFTTDDFGIVMVKMSDKEYKRYQDFVKEYGMSESAFWDFRSDMSIKHLKKEELEERKVWKYKANWNKKK